MTLTEATRVLLDSRKVNALGVKLRDGIGDCLVRRVSEAVNILPDDVVKSFLFDFARHLWGFKSGVAFYAFATV